MKETEQEKQPGLQSLGAWTLGLDPPVPPALTGSGGTSVLEGITRVGMVKQEMRVFLFKVIPGVQQHQYCSLS